MKNISVKHDLISKANTRMVTILAIASAVSMFSLVGVRALFSKMTYQNEVISQRSKAAKQLQDNVKAAKKLVESYQQFDAATESVIGTPDKNSKIALDALPSKYDFPALATSLEKLLSQGGYGITGIVGVDQELQAAQDSADPKPIEIPFQISAQGNYQSMQSLTRDFGRSIRPLHIDELIMTGSSDALRVEITAKTYYQPQKSLQIVEKVVQ